MILKVTETLTIRTVDDIPAKMGEVVKVKDGWHWRAWKQIVDGSRMTDHKLPLDSEKRAPALRIAMPGLVILGLTVRSSPDGMSVTAPNVRLNECRFQKAGEDLLNVHKEAHGFMADRCIFDPASDKALQINGAKNVVVIDCKFARCRNAIRLMGAHAMLIEGNSFRDVDTAIHVTQKGSVRVAVNNWGNTVQHYKTETGGSIIK